MINALKAISMLMVLQKHKAATLHMTKGGKWWVVVEKPSRMGDAWSDYQQTLDLGQDIWQYLGKRKCHCLVCIGKKEKERGKEEKENIFTLSLVGVTIHSFSCKQVVVTLPNNF